MSTRATCQVCGYTTTTDTPARAEYAIRRHSCDRHLERSADRNRRSRERQQRPVRDCDHKGTPHKHGTPAAYVLDKCRCEPCTAAARRYEKVRQLSGRPAYVDATRAVQHIKALQAAGLGCKRIAELAGLENSVVYPLLYGRPDRRNGAPRTQARPRTIAKILAVPMPSLEHYADGARIDATGARRRLQALACLGWSIGRLADHAHMDRQALDHALHQDKVTAATAKTVAALYNQLWATPPTAATRMEQGGITRTRNTAYRNGWLPPLAWDDDQLDNPDTTPAVLRAATTGDDDIDEVAILRALTTGDVRLTPAERVEAVRRLTADGWSDARIAAQLRVTDRTIHRDRQAHGIESRWAA